MKNALLLLLTGLALVSASCSEISTDPAPARATRVAQTVTVTYARTASTIANDTTLQNPRLEVYLLKPVANSDGTFSYPTLTGATPDFVATATDFANPQPITIATNLTVTDNTPSLGVRLVLTTTNRPGRRANSQRLNAAILVNGVSKFTMVHQGLSFSRTAAPTAGVYTTALDTNVASFVF